jgi:hypothetical protein
LKRQEDKDSVFWTCLAQQVLRGHGIAIFRSGIGHGVSIGKHVGHHEWSTVFSGDCEGSKEVHALARPLALEYVENAIAIADVLVAALHHDVQLIAISARLQALEQATEASAEAHAILAIEMHTPWDGRRSVLINVSPMFKGYRQTLTQIVANQRCQISDKGRISLFWPTGELAGSPGKLLRVKDGEAVFFLDARQLLFEPVPLISMA